MELHAENGENYESFKCTEDSHLKMVARKCFGCTFSAFPFDEALNFVICEV